MAKKTKQIRAPEDFIKAADMSVSLLNKNITPKSRKVDRTDVLSGFSKAIENISMEIAGIEKPQRRKKDISINIKTKKKRKNNAKKR